MHAHYCDERGSAGFSWVVDEPQTRTSHALVSGGGVWLVDPVDWPEAIGRARGLGTPAGVLQLLDRHNRDCAALAAALGVPHLVAPDEVPGSPFSCIPVRRKRRWAESALWWPDARTLVVAEAVGTNDFFTGGLEVAGVHLLLRLRPPQALAGYDPEHLLVGHGEGVHGAAAADAVHTALARSRRDLPRVVLRLPRLLLDARKHAKAASG